MINISNKYYKASISPDGGELCSLISNGRELLWKADKKYWGRHAPVLFPIVGKVFNNEYRIEGKKFNLSQHGFARDRKFEVVSKSENECILKLVSDDTTRPLFPFEFELTAHYILDDKKVICRWEVHNTNAITMPCQIGGHPAFNYVNYPEGTKRGSCMFLKNGKPLESFIMQKGLEVKLENGCMKLTSTIFDNGVFILENSQCDEVRLLDNDGKVYLTLRSPKSPVFGIWSPEEKDAPFVCIEPWLGRADTDGYTGEFSQKPWINLIKPAEKMVFEYEITV